MLKVTRFKVEKLHDVFNYDLDFAKGESYGTTILYGDNGSGKTTLLKLMFHILSPTENKGHLTAISKIPFSRAEIQLSDGTKIVVNRVTGVSDFPIDFSITLPSNKQTAFIFVPQSHKSKFLEFLIDNGPEGNIKTKGRRGKAQVSVKGTLSQTVKNILREGVGETARKEYYSMLKEVSSAVYFLGTDRQILNDNIDSLPSLASRGRDYESGVQEQISKLRTAYLKDALQRGSRFLSQQIIDASNVGSKNINDIYAEIFRRILSHKATESDDAENDIRPLIAQLRRLQRRQRKFVKLGLSPDLDVNSFIPNIRHIEEANFPIIAKVLVPFIATLSARLDAMEPIRHSVEKFLESLNNFFKFKTIEYLPANGFRILGPLMEPLEVDQLSSGEQQLLLMFCSVLASNEAPNIFIIDEPEISLNVKWQRNILKALREITYNSKCQLIVSTHSIELLTQQSELVVILDPTLSPGTGNVSENENEDAED